MKRCIIIALFLLTSAAAADPPPPAPNWAWLMSIPHARSGEAVYKVRILEIDGEKQRELIRYAIAPGQHTVTLELMLDLEWEPDLSESAAVPAVKPLQLAVEAGRYYLLAGKVDLDAPAESQLDQSYWEPVVYAVD